jgi:hypothetical protein
MNSPNAPLTRYDVVSDKHGAFLRVFGNPVGPVQGAQPVYTTKDADQLIASLREQLACAQSEAKFAREQLEREREKFAEITKDARAIRAYYATAHTMGFVNAPFWHELADETKQLYRDHIARSPALASLPGGERV